MPVDDYERLIDTLDRPPKGFPRTPARVELRLLGKLNRYLIFEKDASAQ